MASTYSTFVVSFAWAGKPAPPRPYHARIAHRPLECPSLDEVSVEWGLPPRPPLAPRIAQFERFRRPTPGAGVAVESWLGGSPGSFNPICTGGAKSTRLPRQDRRKVMRIPLILLSLLCFGAATRVAQAQRPNFLVIIADDMGYSDAGAYGGEIATPNLDSLAKGGLRFTAFYNTARCWPTRGALLTGYYPQQIRRDGMPGFDHREFGGRGVRPPWARLVSERLREVGYRSYHSGKWHVDGLPTDNGFDRSYESRAGNNFFRAVAHPSHEYGPPPSEAELHGEYYGTIATADHAIGQLREHAEKHAGQPFFSYVAFHAPHFPLHALPEDIARYRDRYVEGWDQLRKQRHERQTRMGLINAALSPLEPEVGPPYPFPDAIEQLGPGEINRPLPWTELTADQRRFQAMKMAIHAAMIDRVDREIGRLLDQLRAMNAFDDTLVLFLSDNGASAEIMVRGEGHDPNAPMGSAKTYLCLGPGFSSSANTPFRRHKTWGARRGNLDALHRALAQGHRREE